LCPAPLHREIRGHLIVRASLMPEGTFLWAAQRHDAPAFMEEERHCQRTYQAQPASGARSRITRAARCKSGVTICRSTRPPNASSAIRPSSSSSRCCSAGGRRLIDGKVASSLVTWAVSKVAVQRMVSLAMLSNSPTDLSFAMRVSTSKANGGRPSEPDDGLRSSLRKRQGTL